MVSRLYGVFTAAVFMLAFFGAARPAAADSERSAVIPLGALNASGENGTATLRASGNSTIVTITITGGSDIEQPAHFHAGTCDHYQPRPLYPLNDVVNGKSTTRVDAPISRLLAGDLIINVHKSYADIATQASCGVSKT